MKGFGEDFGFGFDRAFKGFGDDFGFDFGGTAEAEGVAPGSVTVISYEFENGTATVATRRRRRRWVFEELRQDAEAPGSVGTIEYVSTSGGAFGEAHTSGRTSTIIVELVSGKATAQKVSVVSGKAIGDAKASGAISEISVSAVRGTITGRLDNEFLLTDGDPVVDPIEIDNDFLRAA